MPRGELGSQAIGTCGGPSNGPSRERGVFGASWRPPFGDACCAVISNQMLSIWYVEMRRASLSTGVRRSDWSSTRRSVIYCTSWQNPGFNRWGPLPEAFTSILCLQNASLPRPEKSLVLASSWRRLGVAAAGSQMRRLLGPTDNGVRQDVLMAKGDESKSQTLSDIDDIEARSA